MKHSTLSTTIAAASVVGLLGVIAGCETAPEASTALLEARTAVERASADGNVSKYAPTELDRARKLLSNAEASAKEKNSNDTIAEHYAYLATQMAHIAEQRSSEQVAVARIKSGEVERQQILLSAREAEASSALQAAQQARSEALSARANAQQAEAQVAQAQAE